MRYSDRRSDSYKSIKPVILYFEKVACEENMKIDTEITFNAEKERHLKNLEAIRWFIFGDENNQPQVTYVPEMMQFEKIYMHMKDWVESSIFESNNK